jgi:hypothetical protein
MNFIDEEGFQLDIPVTPMFNVGISTVVVLLTSFFVIELGM